MKLDRNIMPLETTPLFYFSISYCQYINMVAKQTTEVGGNSDITYYKILTFEIGL